MAMFAGVSREMDLGRIVHRRKPDIPVIRPKASDRKQHSLQEACVKSLELTRVIHLLEDPLTTELKERHIFVLKKLLKRNQNGFLLKELTHIAKIFNICAEKVKDHPEYASILSEALKICGLPFLKERASDELKYAQDVTRFLSDMGCLMRVSDAEVRQQLVESVKSFYSSVGPKQLLDGLWPTSPGYRLQLLEHSDLAQTLLLSIAVVRNQPAIKLQLLHTLQILSSSSDINCALILSARGAEMICLHMNDADSSGQVLFRSTEILWNLLERGSKDEVTAQLSSIECVLSLKEAFFHQLLCSFRHCDLQLRNDLLVITSLVAENPKSLLIESLFAKNLLVVTTFPELKSQNPLVNNLKLKYNTLDLRMKQLLLNLLILMSKDLAAIQLYKEEQVMLALLTLIKPPATSSERRSGAAPWSPTQQETLQLHALAVLMTIAPLMLDEYMSCQGNVCLLLLLDWCVGEDAPVGCHGVHSTVTGSRKAQMCHCIRVLRSVTSMGDESVNQDLCDQGFINQLLGILMQMEANPDEEDTTVVEIKSDIQLILSALCEEDMHRKELFGSEGVEMTVHFLRKGCDKFYSGLGHNKLILSTVDCVWSCIVGCYTTEDYFLVKEGVSLLLDLLSSSPRCVHGVVLATLLDFCDNPNALSYIVTWAGDSGQTAPSLLLHLWREEESELGVCRNQHGGIADPTTPVLSHACEETSSRPANVPSAAVLELSENSRAKIYSIFCKLGSQELLGLSAKDYVTLSIVRRYLDFKVGEVWEEISKEFQAAGLRPVTPDEEVLSTIHGITEDKARRVAAEQTSILERGEKDDIKEEHVMYSEVKSHLKQQGLTTKSCGLTTSDLEILKEVKARRGSSRAKQIPEGASLRSAEDDVSTTKYIDART